MDEKDFPHVALIAEEGLSIDELPKDVQSSIRGFKGNLGKYTKNPSDELLMKLKQTSVRIADQIQDFLEEEIPNPNQMTEEEKKAIADKAAADAQAIADAAALEAKTKTDAEAAEAKAKTDAEAAAKAQADADAVAKAAADKKARDGEYGNPILKTIFGV